VTEADVVVTDPFVTFAQPTKPSPVPSAICSVAVAVILVERGELNTASKNTVRVPSQLAESYLKYFGLVCVAS
jgi:hypothetical protein